MRKAIYYFTASLDGYIADADSSTSWLAGAANTDYGFKEFYEGVDTILLGRRAYERMLDMGDFFPYADKEVIVFSSNPHLKKAAECVHIESTDAAKTLARLELGSGGDIWIGGGAHLAGSLYEAGLIDEIVAFVQPIVLGGGLPFFVLPDDKPTETGSDSASQAGHRPLELSYSKQWPGGIVELHYHIPKRWRKL